MQRLQRLELRPIHSHAAVGLGGLPMMHWACMFSVSRPFFYLDSNYTLGSWVWRKWTSPRTLYAPPPPSFWTAWVEGRAASHSVEVKSDHLVPGPYNRDTVSPAKPAGMEPGPEHLVPSNCPWMPLDAPGPRTRTALAHTRTHTWFWIYERQCEQYS